MLACLHLLCILPVHNKGLSLPTHRNPDFHSSDVLPDSDSREDVLKHGAGMSQRCGQGSPVLAPSSTLPLSLCSPSLEGPGRFWLGVKSQLIGVEAKVGEEVKAKPSRDQHQWDRLGIGQSGKLISSHRGATRHPSRCMTGAAPPKGQPAKLG